MIKDIHVICGKNKYKGCTLDCVIQNTKENLYSRLCNPKYKQSRKDTFGSLKNMRVHEELMEVREECVISF